MARGTPPEMHPPLAGTTPYSHSLARLSSITHPSKKGQEALGSCIWQEPCSPEPPLPASCINQRHAGASCCCHHHLWRENEGQSSSSRSRQGHLSPCLFLNPWAQAGRGGYSYFFSPSPVAPLTSYQKHLRQKMLHFIFFAAISLEKMKLVKRPPLFHNFLTQVLNNKTAIHKVYMIA